MVGKQIGFWRDSRFIVIHRSLACNCAATGWFLSQTSTSQQFREASCTFLASSSQRTSILQNGEGNGVGTLPTCPFLPAARAVGSAAPSLGLSAAAGTNMISGCMGECQTAEGAVVALGEPAACAAFRSLRFRTARGLLQAAACWRLQHSLDLHC